MVSEHIWTGVWYCYDPYHEKDFILGSKNHNPLSLRGKNSSGIRTAGECWKWIEAFGWKKEINWHIDRVDSASSAISFVTVGPLEQTPVPGCHTMCPNQRPTARFHNINRTTTINDFTIQPWFSQPIHQSEICPCSQKTEQTNFLPFWKSTSYAVKSSTWSQKNSASQLPINLLITFMVHIPGPGSLRLRTLAELGMWRSSERPSFIPMSFPKTKTEHI